MAFNSGSVTEKGDRSLNQVVVFCRERIWGAGHSRVAVNLPPCSFSASTVGDNGNVFQIVNNRDNNRSQNFVYDNLNRISQTYTTGSSPLATSWGETFTIDNWGNLTNRAGIAGKTNTEGLNVAPATARVTCWTRPTVAACWFRSTFSSNGQRVARRDADTARKCCEIPKILPLAYRPPASKVEEQPCQPASNSTHEAGAC